MPILLVILRMWMLMQPLLILSRTQSSSISAVQATFVQPNSRFRFHRRPALPGVALLDTTAAAVAMEDEQGAGVSRISDSRASPRLWLESHADGAYTVMRCDYQQHCEEHGDASYYQTWGRDFHVQRLQDSYRRLVGQEDATTAPPATSRAIEAATLRTEALIDSLIDQVRRELLPLADEKGRRAAQRTVVMLTLLWHPVPMAAAAAAAAATAAGAIQIQGHACLGMKDTTDCSAGLPPFHAYNPDPITVAVAVSPNLPNRQPHPDAKLSAWCHERRPLEVRYGSGDNADSVKEVILVANSNIDTDDSCCLLEGLTSNLFVLYPGNVLRTSSATNVLPGYARHLILQTKSEWHIDTVTPIRLDEAHLWLQVFCTSSIRLVIPVNRILAPRRRRRPPPTDDETAPGGKQPELVEIWRMDEQKHKNQLVWRKLYETLLENQYKEDT